MNTKSKSKKIKRTTIFLFLFILFFTLAQNLSAAYTWQNVVVPAGGYVSGVDYSPVQSGLIYARTDMGGLYRWDNTNNVWIPLTDFLSDWNLYGGESIAPDPVNANNVYAAIGQTYNNTDGYILASTNQGNSWTQYPIGVLIGGNNDGRNAGERLVVDPNLNTILYFGSRSGGLWKSTNSAATWAQVTSFPVNGDAGYGLSWEVFLPGGNPGAGTETIFVGVEALNSGNSNIYRSTNAGTSWAVVPGGPTSMAPPHASLGTDGNLWISYLSGGYGPGTAPTGQIWKLNTSTLAWTNITPANGPTSGNGGYSGISVDPENAQHAVCSTLDWYSGPDHTFSTTNGGTSWTVIGNVNVGWNTGPFATYNINGAEWTYFCTNPAGGTGWEGDVKIDPFNSNNAIYTTGGGVWSSTNIEGTAITWTFTDYGLEETAILDMTSSVAGGVLFSAMGDITGMRHNDITKSPALGMYCPALSDTDSIDYAELNTNIVVRVGHNTNNTGTNFAYYSTNNGQTWITCTANVNGTSASPGANDGNGQISVSANGNIFVWAPATGIYYSTNNGTTWNTSTTPNNGIQYQICSDRSNNNIFYAISGDTLYMSNNGGQTFTQAGTFAGTISWANRPRAVFGIAGEVWVPTSTGLYRFTNVGLGTVTTTQIANVTQGVAVGFGMAASGQTHPAVYLIGTVNGTYGFYRCDDGVGTTWTQINDANHQYGGGEFIAGDETVYGRAYVGTNGRGILYGDISTSGTSTITPTNTHAMTATFTPTLSRTATPTFTFTYTFTRTDTPTYTNTFTPSVTVTNSQQMSATSTRTDTLTYTTTVTVTGTYTETSTITRTVTGTYTVTALNTATNTSTGTFTSTDTLTLTATSTKTNTGTSTPTMTLTSTITWTATTTAINTATSTGTQTYTPTSSRTSTLTYTATGTNTLLPTGTLTATSSSTLTKTNTVTLTLTNTPINTATSTATGTNTLIPTGTSTTTRTNTATDTLTTTQTQTNTPSFTATSTFTKTVTPTCTNSPIVSATPTFTNIVFTWTITQTFTISPTITATDTLLPTDTGTGTTTPTSTLTGTVTSTITSTYTGTKTNTVTGTMTSTLSNTPTGTLTFTPTLTSTITATLTITLTNTCACTATYTSTGTSTITVTITSTNTPKDTMTLTTTETLTNTVTQTITDTEIVSATPTFTNIVLTWTITQTSTQTAIDTYTATETERITQTNTTTATLTVSETEIITMTLTNTQTPPDTATFTQTQIPSASITETASATIQNTTTGTATTTQTEISSLTTTMTYTLLPTFTYTPIPSLTLTAVITATTTILNSQLPTATITVTSTQQVIITFTATPGPYKKPKPYPNPINPNRDPYLKIAYDLDRNTDSLTIKIYTVAYRLVMEYTFDKIGVQQILQQGIECPTDRLKNLSNGTYYYVIITKSGNNQSRSTVDKFILIK